MNRVGHWFRALEEMGEDASIEAGLTEWPLDQMKKYPHSEYDGIAVMSEFLMSLDSGMDLTKITPTVPSRDPIPFLFQLMGLCKYLSTLPLNGRRYKSQKTINAYEKGEPKRVFTYFSEEETILCEKLVLEKKISMNAWLVYCLSKAVEPYLIENNKPQIWMIPISIREKIQDSFKKKLKSGFVDAFIYSDTGPVEINAEMKKKIKNGQAWGGYLGFSISSLFGFTFLKFIIKNNYRFQMRMGVFTNLGKWGDVNLKHLYPNNTIGFAPVVYENPIATVTLTWMGRTWLSLKAHSSLELSETELQKIVDDWKKFILNAS